MTEERFIEITSIFLTEIDMEEWNVGNILEPASFLLGYLAGKNISIIEATEFVRILLTTTNELSKKIDELSGEENETQSNYRN